MPKNAQTLTHNPVLPIIPNECIQHFTTNETVDSKCLWKILSLCEPENSGNFHILDRLLRIEIQVKILI